MVSFDEFAAMKKGYQDVKRSGVAPTFSKSTTNVWDSKDRGEQLEAAYRVGRKLAALELHYNEIKEANVYSEAVYRLEGDIDPAFGGLAPFKELAVEGKFDILEPALDKYLGMKTMTLEGALKANQNMIKGFGLPKNIDLKEYMRILHQKIAEGKKRYSDIYDPVTRAEILDEMGIELYSDEDHEILKMWDTIV